MVGVQQSLNSEGVSLHWVHGEANLADALTKDGADAVMHDFQGRKQYWTLVHDPSMRSAKKRRTERVGRLETVNYNDKLKAWDFSWPEKPPTVAADSAARCEYGLASQSVLSCSIAAAAPL